MDILIKSKYKGFFLLPLTWAAWVTMAVDGRCFAVAYCFVSTTVFRSRLILFEVVAGSGSCGGLCCRSTRPFILRLRKLVFYTPNPQHTSLHGQRCRHRATLALANSRINEITRNIQLATDTKRLIESNSVFGWVWILSPALWISDWTRDAFRATSAYSSSS